MKRRDCAVLGGKCIRVFNAIFNPNFSLMILSFISSRKNMTQEERNSICGQVILKANESGYKRTKGKQQLSSEDYLKGAEKGAMIILVEYPINAR